METPPASQTPGKLVVISGPSGAGKTTVLRRVFDQAQVPLVASVSATTRPPRQGEVDGRDYHFLTDEEFQRRRAAGEFLECFEVFGRGYWYGTLRKAVTPGLAAGKWVVLEIDVDGAMSVLEQYPAAISIFIRPRSLDELRRRLQERGTETAEQLARRLEVARHEISLEHRYRHLVINDDVDRAAEEICQILSGAGE
ncbi:MAG: guanylate kinase [Planctomycetota bacterium]|nr:MAG: guanylate kinase [Planctomycetota bacterium]REJ93967.1 MAG: guanylate kinase [Planctomycetota bacterium]REK30947.1 MAG: guanylate kinase [Planctomycetota bacterium]REK38199.1 MAG: guanylate kinase [Planctomycetota bacterium]